MSADADAPATDAVSEGPSKETETQGDYAKEPTLWQQQVGALCWTCYGHDRVADLKGTQKAQLTREAKAIFKERDYTLDELRTWYTDEWKTHWPGNKGDRPSPSTVRSSIAAVRAAPDPMMAEPDTPEAFWEMVDNMEIGAAA